MAQNSYTSFFILLYVDDVVLFTYKLDYIQHLVNTLYTFCQISELAFNVKKRKNDGNKDDKYKRHPHLCMQSSTSYVVVQLDTFARPMEVLVS